MLELVFSRPQPGHCISKSSVLGGIGGPQALLSGFEGETLPGGQVIPSLFLLPPPKAAQKEANKVGL